MTNNEYSARENGLAFNYFLGRVANLIDKKDRPYSAEPLQNTEAHNERAPMVRIEKSASSNALENLVEELS